MIDGIVVVIGLIPTLALGYILLDDLRAMRKKVEQKDMTAKERSLILLASWLSRPQLKQYREYGYFDVVGGLSGRKYRIHCITTPYNISEIDENGNLAAKLCFGPVTYKLPDGDILLTQKLSLELDECEALFLANRSTTFTPIPEAWGGIAGSPSY